ncbi:MAG: hypothetical protein ABW212_00040 [Pseudonocardia sediminis]
MRLGRKLAEGFAVDHEADRAYTGRHEPEAEAATPLADVPEVLATELPVPARSGPRAAD